MKKLQLIYILPNLFTAASAFLGVISIISSLQGNYQKALLYIILSLICDGLDGRIARLTNSTSKFGVEFDSLADLVAFGVAPAIFFYVSIGINFGRFGALITAFFVIFGAIRLARFNVTTGTYEPSIFIGLPIPTAAIVSAIYTYAYVSYDFLRDYDTIFLILQALLSFLMVSNIRYPSFKKIDFSRSSVLKVLVCLIISFSILYLYPLESVVIVVSVYVLYGLLRAIYMLCNAKFKKQ
ncbi:MULTISPECIES: CDP-diacylglycerol--serine O-phosphatidyltransferase [unclassified Campylobacter]|uniref:CDP-diacylglycerol--serine O-phosphatidyltransferase n=1 Tax=unclassified Campylobacter TaxID=2593542 RepID=UPI001237A7E0|nr:MULTISPECIES: CDP-diacylglycerol--serine O-phosphatidyltransferase [unclassified Campylobacter]KAA6225480.1 CDP-diacylglycerol--serine O-phosphatidyltransferase [Campylobacter sp. LR196d]KAA6227418.1 CDP-diacylglycerol--serine O-phosphatidyltransferase [Campylobacter sp. LR185c]KAA6229751.1 CDP-diacylglycerol--serine O-phosphatidyltransferase [Campylobacter sp. LR286c]KAA6234276.1 CDP-diacylglycerol--serine O-phosphatidyltransferase [Campylobacter sp. LR291e]KAA6234494.1 CDP-diacylglycerol-